MEFLEVLEKRYSVRKFQNIDIPDSDIDEIIKCASLAPSGKNTQNWHYVIIKNAEMKEKMGKAVEDKMAKIAENLPDEKGEKFLKFSRFTTFFTKAPVVIAVYAGEYVPEGLDELLEAKMPEVEGDRMWYANPGIQSIGAGIATLGYAAVAKGYGTCWMTSPNHSLLELEEVIGFKKDKYKLCALIPLGVPEGNKKSPAKKNVEEISTYIK